MFLKQFFVKWTVSRYLFLYLVFSIQLIANKIADSSYGIVVSKVTVLQTTNAKSILKQFLIELKLFYLTPSN